MLHEQVVNFLSVPAVGEQLFHAAQALDRLALEGLLGLDSSMQG